MCPEATHGACDTGDRFQMSQFLWLARPLRDFAFHLAGSAEALGYSHSVRSAARANVAEEAVARSV